MTTNVPLVAEINAPASWRTVDFISDLHLQASETGTFSAWQHYLQHTPADAVFILGDLFEVWVGDDVVDDAAPGAPNFETQCAHVLQLAGRRLALFFMHGNRDFLVGTTLMAHCHAQLLHDPCTLVFNQQRWLLSHGDELCLDDVPYQQFRQLVRGAQWQADFLAKPLAVRQAMARHMRQQSEASKQATTTFADADTAMTLRWLAAAQAHTLIHGHTHQPTDHALGDHQRRVVLSDWDIAATPPRAEVLRLTASGLQRMALV